LATHNSAREEYGAPPLVWDDNLAGSVQNYTDRCQFSHSNGGGAYGENIAASTEPGWSIQDAVDQWMAESCAFLATSQNSGHFTQVVWKGTRSVACGITSCPPHTVFLTDDGGATYIVCRYSPPGNVQGQ
ncbi:PR-1-like protein, partial [Cylindrobasidium torrendii FP15055 ss-10]